MPAVQIQPIAPKAKSEGLVSNPSDVYVGNLPYDVTEHEVLQHFQQCGQVVRVTIPKDLATGNGRGFAFVRMANQELAQQAIEQLNGSTVKGRSIRLDWAR